MTSASASDVQVDGSLGKSLSAKVSVTGGRGKKKKHLHRTSMRKNIDSKEGLSNSMAIEEEPIALNSSVSDREDNPLCTDW